MSRYTKYTLTISILISTLVFAYYCVQPIQKGQVDGFLSMSHKELLTYHKKDRPDLAALHDYKITLDPALGYPPRERLFEAKTYSDNLIKRKNSIRAIDNVQWTERGPDNVAGRTRAIMFDPNDPEDKKVWAGSVGGGLWTNEDITDVNVQWEPVDDFLPNLAISTLAYDPINTSVFYFGTGEGWRNIDAIRGAGIWQSADGGNNWTRLSSTEEGFEYVQKIVVTDESTVLAAVRASSNDNDSGILRSEDGGQSWTLVLGADYGVDIEKTGDNLYASTMDGRLYKSVDDGVNWINISPETGADRIEIGVSEGFPDYVYAVGNVDVDAEWIYSSQDGGDSWTEVTVPKYYNTNCSESNEAFTRGQGWYDLIIAVSPNDPTTLVLGGVDLYRSDDGGETWDLISYWTGGCSTYVHADQHNFLFRPNSGSEGISSNDGGVFYATDLDTQSPDFKARNNNYNVTQFYSCAMGNEPLSNIFLTGAQDNGSHLYTDYGINSTLEVTDGDGAFCFIDQNDQDFMITSYVYNTYFVSTDGMSSSTEFGVGSESGQFINPSEYDSRTQTLFAAANSDQINVYTDLSGNITERTKSIDIDNSSVSAIEPALATSDDVYVGTYSGTIFKIEGVFDTSPTTNLLGDFLGTISSISVGSSDDQILVTLSNYGITSVYETRDGGDNWESKEGNLPDMPIRWGLYNPNNTDEVLLATELGVWSVDDISVNDVEWEPSNDGLANVSCHMLTYRDSDGLVAVATHGRGLFTTDIFATESFADFSTEAPVAYAGIDFEFVNRSLGATTYAWDFGDGSISSAENPNNIFSTEGVYTVTLTIDDDINNTISKEITVLPSLPIDFNLTNGGNFETNEGYFAPITITGTGFELGASTVEEKSGTNSGDNAWVTGLLDNRYSSWTEAYLYTPAFDFSLSGDYEMSFFTKYAIEDEWEGFIVEYSLNAGQTWQKLGTEVDEENWYNQTATSQAIVFSGGEPLFSGDTDGVFEEKTISMGFLSNSESVAFRFVFKTDPASEEAGIAIDDFTILGPVNSAPSISFEVNDQTACIGNVVEVTNTSNGTINSYAWDFGEGANPETGVGYGPFFITYSTLGEKSIVMMAETDEGQLTESINLTVSTPPSESALSGVTSICEGENVTVTVETSELGVSYQLIDMLNEESLEGDVVIGTGESISLISNPVLTNSTFGVVATNESGCSVNLSTTIEVDSEDLPEVSISLRPSGELQASFLEAEEYVWLLNGQIIDEADDQIYAPAEDGDYTVEVSNSDGCIGESEEFQYTLLSADDISIDLNVFPNPVDNELQVDSSYEIVDLTVINLAGKVLQSYAPKSNKVYIDFSTFSKGVYILKMNINNTIVSKQIIKQ